MKDYVTYELMKAYSAYDADHAIKNGRYIGAVNYKIYAANARFDIYDVHEREGEMYDWTVY